jgi:Na+-driven multidrug efflux pump
MLRSKNILNSIKNLGHSGAFRSGVVVSTSGVVGLIAGKRGDARTVPLVALGTGAALNLVGANALGDGAMAGGATILGYRMGAKSARQATQLTAAPRMAPGLQHAGKHRRA